MMHEKPPGESTTRKRLVLAGAVILGLVVGIGIGWAFDGSGETAAEVTVPSAVETIHSEWFSAWNVADGEAVVAMMTPGGRHYCPGTGGEGASGRELAEFVTKGFTISDVETVGAVSMDSPGDASGASQDHIVVAELTIDGHSGYVSVLHVRGPEDALRVVSHRSFP